MENEYYRVKLKYMYVKDFLIKAHKNDQNKWSIRSEIILTNVEEDGIPICEQDAQKIMNMLGSDAFLEKIESEVTELK